jgi:teichuronic acid biosynthesis glycosyltransferase TuaC
MLDCQQLQPSVRVRATLAPAVRALLLSNMRPDARHPERGSFVRDQFAALQALADVEVELYEFPPGPRALAAATLSLRGRYRGRSFDVVHAHFGLSAYCAPAVKARVRALTVHGTDLTHPRSALLTRAAAHWIDLLAAPSRELAKLLPDPDRVAILPCGVDMQRFKPARRAQARARIGVDPAQPCLLFPADPARPEKRFDRVRALAQTLTGDHRLLHLGGVAPARVPDYVNAANVVLITSEREGFGLAALEALACEVPVLATPVGIHREALAGLEGTLCAPFARERWSALVEAHLAAPEPRIAGRARAAQWSSERMAEAVAAAWKAALERQDAQN